MPRPYQRQRSLVAPKAEHPAVVLDKMVRAVERHRLVALVAVVRPTHVLRRDVPFGVQAEQCIPPVLQEPEQGRHRGDQFRIRIRVEDVLPLCGRQVPDLGLHRPTPDVLVLRLDEHILTPERLNPGHGHRHSRHKIMPTLHASDRALPCGVAERHDVHAAVRHASPENRPNRSQCRPKIGLGNSQSPAYLGSRRRRRNVLLHGVPAINCTTAASLVRSHAAWVYLVTHSRMSSGGVESIIASSTARTNWSRFPASYRWIPMPSSSSNTPTPIGITVGTPQARACMGPCPVPSIVEVLTYTDSRWKNSWSRSHGQRRHSHGQPRPAASKSTLCITGCRISRPNSASPLRPAG